MHTTLGDSRLKSLPQEVVELAECRYWQNFVGAASRRDCGHIKDRCWSDAVANLLSASQSPVGTGSYNTNYELRAVWRIAGAALGFIGAYTGITLDLIGGGMTIGAAGVYFGIVAALFGISCSAIGFFSRKRINATAANP